LGLIARLIGLLPILPSGWPGLSLAAAVALAQVL
jgi:hypothetical protein